MQLNKLLNKLNTMTFSNVLLTFLTILTTLLVLRIFKKKKDDEKKLPPGPKKLPIIGNLHQLSQPLHQTFRRFSAEHGPLMFMHLGSYPTLVVSSAAMAKEVLKTQDLIFSSRPVLYAPNKLSYNGSTITFAPYGEYWRDIKKIALLELLSAKRVQSFEAVREDEVALMNEFVADSSAKSILINVSELMVLLLNNVVLRIVFSERGKYGENSGKSKFDELLHETMELTGMVNIADSFPWMSWLNKWNGIDAAFDKNIKEMDIFFDKVIKEHRENPRTDHEDLVDVLLRVQNDPNQALRLTDVQIKAVLKDMFIAGTDTAAATLVWTMTELIRKPSVMRKAQEEVRGIAKEKVKESDLPKLTYLKMIVKEALRLHPAGPLLLPHETTKRSRLGGYEIPAKTRVFVNVAAIGRDPENWENPDEFKPERFLNNSVDYRGQHFELLPFGAGRRSCPGISFAVVIMELAIANLLFSFDWSLPDGMSAQDVDMTESIGIGITKKIPLCLVASRPTKSNHPSV